VAAFEAGNLDIPTLDLAMQSDGLVPPVIPYGALARTARPEGTVHFYVDDGKFTRLWARPARLLLGGYSMAIEPNFSTTPKTPYVQALYDVYRKRRLASIWQRNGIRIIVDLNVDPRFRDIALLGVPPSWAAYAVRAQRGIGWEEVEADFAMAQAHSGRSDPMFVCVGGGKYARKFAESRGWTWVPEHSHVVRGREKAYGLAGCLV
jgi:hypothetical protein